ncbi:MAG: hypothetical protein HZB31_03270 [Nitrospirae bacterium]|nr:hypothetical protein [Nitrospirota bacterium]
MKTMKVNKTTMQTALVKPAVFCLLIFACLFALAPTADAATRTFPKGSFIIPFDPCWQPNKECFSNAATFTLDTTKCPEYKDYAYGKIGTTTYHAECDTALNDQGTFQAYGFIYDLLKIGVPAYWVINPDKEVGPGGTITAPDTANTKGRHAIDFFISKSGTDAAVQIKHSSALTTSGTTSPINYRGGPFVIDINDYNALDSTKKASFDAALSYYTSMRYHVANYDFSAPVDKVLTGTPPKVAVLGEGATSILLDYLKASGLGSRVYDIFSTITKEEVIAGDLDNFQLLWAPHWIIDDGCGDKCSASGNCPSGYTMNTTLCPVSPASCYKAPVAASCDTASCPSGYSFSTSYCTTGANRCQKSNSPNQHSCVAPICSSGTPDTVTCTDTNATGHRKYCSVPATIAECVNPTCNTGVVNTTECPASPNICYYSGYSTGCKIAPADQTTIMSEIRGFLEKGNAALFECASLESMEGSYQYDGNKTAGNTVTTGGFLTAKTYAPPRLDTNGGLCNDISSCDQTKIAVEGTTNFINQCAGWVHMPASGHVKNFRPLLTPSPDYGWNSTVTRFIHDKDTTAYSSPREAAPPAYDYFVGGRINGSATQGYVAYIAGHKYLKCSNAATITPSERLLDLTFDKDISAVNLTNPNIVTIEAVLNTPNPPNYPSLTGSCTCVVGSTCPKLQIDLTNIVENITTQVCGVYISSDGTTYNPTTKTLMGLKIGSLQPYGSGTADPGANLNIKELRVTFPKGVVGPPLIADPKLTTVVDVTDDVTGGCSVCSPNTASQSICTPTKNITYDTGGVAICSATATGMQFGPLLTNCDVDWDSSTTCGTKYILNSLLGLQLQIVPNEYVKAGAVQKDNILYKATFEFPGYKGHLYAIDVTTNPATKLWDAGANSVMPPAGASGANPANPTNANAARYIFTTLPGSTTKMGFEVGNIGTVQTDATKLWHYLDPDAVKTLNGVKALVNSVRGRKNADDTLPAGDKELSKRLGGIEHSTPAVLTRSDLVTGAGSRDKIIFAGGHDGMLHAFYGGAWNSTTKTYSTGSGKEIWAYIPSALLTSLKNQTFTDCNPGETITSCDPATDPNHCVCPVFSYAVSVDSSPAVGDFFVDHDNNISTPNQWRTILVATATTAQPGVISEGIVFALDVSDPYTPSVLWERTYSSKVNPVSSTNPMRNYYPTGSFPSTYTTAEAMTIGLHFDPNMGNSKGVAIGRVQIGTTLDTNIILTAPWLRPVDINPLGAAHNVQGLSVFGLNFRTGDLVWETKIMYTGDAENVNYTPSIPALMDYGNNGTDDYVLFGDMQGRLWILRAVDGVSIAADGSAGNGPAFYVPSNLTTLVMPEATSTLAAGVKEPIGSMVSISGHKIVFGTGGRESLQDEATTKYHLFAFQFESDKTLTNLWASLDDKSFATNDGEKIWIQPLVDSSGTVYLGTAKGYTDIGQPDLVKTVSTGRFLALSLKPTDDLVNIGKKSVLTLSKDIGSPVVGGLAIENNHVSILSFDGKFIQLGDGNFTPNAVQENPVKTLWWRTLQ